MYADTKDAQNIIKLNIHTLEIYMYIHTSIYQQSEIPQNSIVLYSLFFFSLSYVSKCSEESAFCLSFFLTKSQEFIIISFQKNCFVFCFVFYTSLLIKLIT